MNKELKPCPFCGEEGESKTYTQGLCQKRIIWIECKNCKAQTNAFEESLYYSAMDKATEAWNRRAEEKRETDI